MAQVAVVVGRLGEVCLRSSGKVFIGRLDRISVWCWFWIGLGVGPGTAVFRLCRVDDRPSKW